jgi:hypothetical protein
MCVKHARTRHVLSIHVALFPVVIDSAVLFGQDFVCTIMYECVGHQCMCVNMAILRSLQCCLSTACLLAIWLRHAHSNDSQCSMRKPGLDPVPATSMFVIAWMASKILGLRALKVC